MHGVVAHVLRKYDPLEWGGTETYVAELTRRLGGEGWPCEVHAPAGPRTPDRALAPDVKLVRFRAFLPFLGPADRRAALVAIAGNMVSLEMPLRLALDRHVRLAHLHTQGRIGGGARTAMRLTGRPYVVSVHGPLLAEPDLVAAETKRRLEGLRDLGQPFGALLGARRVIDDAARVIAFNDRERDAIAARIGDRALRMDHGVDLRRFAAGDERRARQRWPGVGTAPVVVLVGRVCAQKNQLLAARAFAKGAPADHHLAFAGAPTDLGYREVVEAEVRSLGIGDRVHWLGNLEPSEVPDALALGRLVLVPSTHEAFGLAVLEGWAAARPVLFARRSGLADLAAAFGDDEATPATLEPADWAAALSRHLTSEPRLRSTAERGTALVRSRFDWDAVARKVAAVYAEVVAEAGRRR